MRVCCLFPSGPAAGKKSCTFITPHEAGNVRGGIGRGVQVKYRGGGVRGMLLSSPRTYDNVHQHMRPTEPH